MAVRHLLQIKSSQNQALFSPLAWGKLSLRIVSRGLTQHPPQFNASASLALEPPWPWAALTLESRMSRAYTGHEKRLLSAEPNSAVGL